jgi:hypothetical protein
MYYTTLLIKSQSLTTHFLVTINNSIGDNMAGYDPAKAARMNQLAQQYPNASLSTLATLARVSVSDLGNYTNDSVGTRASNANFGRVTSEESQNTQSSNTPRNTVGSGSAFAGNDIPPSNVSSVSSTPSINPFTGRAYTTPPTPVVTSPPSSQNNTNSSGSAGSQFAFSDTPTPVVSSPTSSQTATNTTGSGTSFQGGGTITGQAFGNGGRDPAPAPDPFPAPPPARPVQAQDSDVDFTDAYGEDYRQATPIPTPVVQPQDDDVDFTDAYGDSYTEVTPIPPSTRRPGVEQATVPVGSRGSGEFLDDRGRAPAEQPDPFPAAPPARPVESFDAPVDDFSGYPVTQVDDFSGPSRNITQVDDFGDIPAPAQVDDFSAYSNNNFGTEDPGLDAFGPGPTPPPPANVQEYQQFDAFGDVVEPQPQVDSFDEYSDNDFGIADEQDFSDFATPNQVNTFGVDDFGDPEAAQFDEFGDPLTAPADVNPFGVDDFGDPEAAQFDEFGDPILAPEDRIDNDGESLVGDDPVADIGDGAEGDGIDGVEQAAITEAQQAAIQAQALKQKAQQQQTVSEMREASGVKNADGDWRVKLRLAPQATYLYKAPEPGILAPLAVTDGIIFPYTPTIDVQYRAEYQNYSPTHSNYQHYFYKNSSVQTVQLQAEFTAQDTIEAEYLLAVIHFLKSASKMFYGQDAERGSPPPLLYLTGLGEYQFNEAPCVVTEFNYNLPNDVNYIRARSRHINRDDQLQFTKPLASTVSNGNFSALNRLQTAVTNAVSGGPGPTLAPGAKPTKITPGKLGSKGATYVPTKMAMTINMLPVISRQQASQQFSLKDYANGSLIKKGMW